MTYPLATALVLFTLLILPGVGNAQEPAVPQSREEITLSFAPVVKQAAPAVVNIYTKTRVQVQSGLSPFMDDPFFRQFFGRNFAFPERTREKVVSSLGSGVIVRPDGMIVTAHHVIRNAQEIKVALADQREFEAKVVLRDEQADLAFLKIDAREPLPFLEIRNSDTLEVGELVLAVGNPFGVGQTVTQGIISALARKAAGVSDYAFFIQTDAAINPGNSGGALADMNGRLIGINTAIYSRTGGSLGIGFAIPSNMVRVLLESKTEGGRVIRPWLGISVQPVTSEIAESLGMASPRGVLIHKIFEGSPAEKAGLKVGDVVLAVGGSAIASQQEMHYRLALIRVGDKSEFKILRDGKEQAVTVEMQAPPETPKRDQRTLKGRHPLEGLTVANLSPALAVELGMDDLDAEGVVVMQAGVGSAISGAFAPGDVILEVNGVPVKSTQQLEEILKLEASVKKDTHEWTIVYIHQGKTITLTARM